MTEWQSYTNSTVLFTKTHWMTEETAILYLQFIVKLFPEKIIGLVWDKAPSHVADLVKSHVEEHNAKMEENKSRSRLVIDYVDNCLTGIYQPCDVVVIALLKRILCRKYHEALSEKIQSGSLAPGDLLKISREELTTWLEEAVEEINNEQADKNYYISKAFSKCGLDFRVKGWDEEYPEEFKKHLESLGNERLYKSLTEAHEATKLEEKAPPSTCSS